MKRLGLLVLFLNAFLSKAQESQEITALKWKDGVYDQYTVDFFNDSKWQKSTEKVNLTIKKGNKNKSIKISLKGVLITPREFTHNDSLSTPFVRYYTNKETYDDYKVYFNNNTIVMFTVKKMAAKPEIQLMYFFGQAPQNNIKEEILTYLEQTSSYFVPTSIYESKDIESITAKIISETDELSSGTYIELGLIFKMKSGMEVQSKNLGGNIDLKNFKISSDQLKEYLEGKKSVWKVDCSKTINKEMEIIVWLIYSPNDKFKTLIPVKCDTENSPVVIQGKIINEYDAVIYNSEIGNVTLKKLEGTGYSTYPNALKELFDKKNIETDLIRVSKNNKIGYINKNGKLIIPLEYDGGGISDFKNKVIPVYKNGKWGFINFQNKVITDFIYDKVYKESNGVTSVVKDNKCGYVNAEGKQFVNTIYDNAFDFNSLNSAVVKLNNKYGCIDKTGKIVVQIDYEKSPRALNSDLFVVHKNDKYGIIKKDGKMLFDYKYDEIYNCGTAWGNAKDCEKYIRVKKDGLYGFVKTDGTVFRECIFNTANDFSGNIASITKTENGVEKKGQLLLNASDGKGNVYKNGYENLQEIEQEKDDVTTSSKSNTKSGTKAVSDKKTLKNTGKNPLYYRTSKGGSASHLNGGSSTTISCSNPIYYCNDDGKGNHTVTGQLISGANQDCGSTVTAQGGN
ncbi:MAG: WG repeat-containing protein [Bacteroidota bacterium]|nr:WG repeat-containing protein [Bacteroidota bacterium]